MLSDIIKREEKQGTYSSRGSKIALRGLYYMSPWVRDLQACIELRDHFRKIVGEELIPHPSYSNSPQVSRSFLYEKLSLRRRIRPNLGEFEH